MSLNTSLRVTMILQNNEEMIAKAEPPVQQPA